MSTRSTTLEPLLKDPAPEVVEVTSEAIRRLRAYGAVAQAVRRSRLRRRFYARPTLEVAADLIGKVLVHDVPAGRDGGPHRGGGGLHRRRRSRPVTPRPGPRSATQPLYGPPGIAYVYLNYGVHYLTNIVTESDGFPAAVLLRALEPLEGVPLMRRRRARGTRHDAVGYRPQRALPGTGQPVEGARDHAARRTASTSRVRRSASRTGDCRLVSGTGARESGSAWGPIASGDATRSAARPCRRKWGRPREMGMGTVPDPITSGRSTGGSGPRRCPARPAARGRCSARAAACDWRDCRRPCTRPASW